MSSRSQTQAGCVADDRSSKGVGASAPAPGSPKISFAGLSKHYGGVQALDDVGFDVEAGTIHAVIGENGAGKSTLMKILAGAVKPDSGTITLDGEPFDALSPRQAHQRGIGIVYQELSLFPRALRARQPLPEQRGDALRARLARRDGQARRAGARARSGSTSTSTAGSGSSRSASSSSSSSAASSSPSRRC